MKLLPNAAASLFIAFLLAAPVVAQKSGGKAGGSHSAPTSNAPNTGPGYKPTSGESAFDIYDVTRPGVGQQKLKNEQPPCFHWPMNPVLSATVSTSRMEIPAKARSEFSEGCAAVREKKLSSAQQHLSQAIQQFPKFAAAWALLGQTEEDLGHQEKAVEACNSARNGDPTYLPGYLCLAELAARQNKWDQVADLTNQVIGMHPVKAPAAFYYNCLANFYLKQWTPAEKSALRAIDEGPKAYAPQVHWLLAKIYEEKGDRSLEAEHLREYLNLAPHAADAAIARQILQQIESAFPDKNAANGNKPTEKP
jgi:tetratricopeptide (TPR) repeat protein